MSWPAFCAARATGANGSKCPGPPTKLNSIRTGPSCLDVDAGLLYTSHTRYVYDQCMARVRTNLEIESTYLDEIMTRYGVHTKTEAVDLALRHLAGQPMTREEALAMRGARAIGSVPVDRPPPRP